MVAREGTAPSISGCKPDVMLFHHRAIETRNSECGVRNKLMDVGLVSVAPRFALRVPRLNWLRETDSHHRLRFQRAPSY